MSIENPSIAPEELRAAIGLPHCPILLDTRRQSAFEAADRVIAGAAWRDHLAVDEWGPLIPSERDVVVYCVHGHQVSRSAVARLRERGLNARVLTGGIEAFIDAGGITIRKIDDLPMSFDAPSRWVTRENPKVDRLACLWLIRRFVDSSAEILFVDPDWVMDSTIELDAIPIDDSNAAFAPDENKCGFDALLRRYAIGDPALDRLAVIVRDANAGRSGLAPEAQGLLAISHGISSANRDDHTVLSQGMVLFDALYAWLRNRTAETHDSPTSVCP